jgi:hypothetical protein
MSRAAAFTNAVIRNERNIRVIENDKGCEQVTKVNVMGR